MREACEACEGTGEIPCQCHRCRSPEGRAWGVMGRGGWKCAECEGTGLVCSACGYAGCDCNDDENVQEVAA